MNDDMNLSVDAALRETIKARRKDIAEQAVCEGCGATLAECRELQAANNDPTAPKWTGCCAMGTGMAACRHHPAGDLLVGLLAEIERGTVDSVAEVVARREAKKALRDRQRAEATPPGAQWPLTYADMFQQGEWWRTRDSGWIRIAEMKTSHRANTARFLDRRVASIVQKVATSEMFSASRAPDDVVDSVIAADADRRADPMGWLRGTPLYHALVDGVDIAEHATPVTPPARRVTGHSFSGVGTTCDFPVAEGAGDDFIRCGEPAEAHA